VKKLWDWLRLRDPVWQGLGALIGLAAIGATVFVSYDIYSKSQPRTSTPRLEITILGYDYYAALRTNRKIAVLFEEEPLSSFLVMNSWLSYAGPRPLLPADFVEPLRVSAAKPWCILDVGPESPDDPVPTEWTKVSENAFEMKPTLFNPGDRASIHLLVVDTSGQSAGEPMPDPPDLRWSGRVAGIPYLEGDRTPFVLSRIRSYDIGVSHSGWVFVIFSLVYLLLAFLLARLGTGSGRLPWLSPRHFAILLSILVAAFAGSEMLTRHYIERRLQERSVPLLVINLWAMPILAAYLSWPYLRAKIVSFLRSIYTPPSGRSDDRQGAEPPNGSLNAP